MEHGKIRNGTRMCAIKQAKIKLPEPLKTTMRPHSRTHRPAKVIPVVSPLPKMLTNRRFEAKEATDDADLDTAYLLNTDVKRDRSQNGVSRSIKAIALANVDWQLFAEVLP